jgi:signal transduction histidine kinase
MLNKTITQNKIFLYMVIHDLKHPTESMISQLNAMHLSLIDQIQTINTITERQERIEKFTTDLLLNRKASTNLNASIMEP